jgi:hypothetical protein
MSYPLPDILNHYGKAIAKVDGIELKGKSVPNTSINGHMTSFLDKDGIMGLRLAPGELATFLKEHHTELMDQHGRIMKEFAVVPAAVFNHLDLLVRYMKMSVTSTKALKPK